MIVKRQISSEDTAWEREKTEALVISLSLFLMILITLIISVGYVPYTYAQLANSAWPCLGHDARHTGQSPYVGAQTNTVKWSYTTTEDGVLFSVPTIGADGTIYVGNYNDNNLYALNPDGSLKWSYTTVGHVSSSPAISIDGIIYLVSGDRFYALNQDGSLRWSYASGKRFDASPAIGADGTIYVGNYDGRLYALNPNGSPKWSYYTAVYRVFSSPAIGADGTIYVGSDDNKLYALNPNGSLKWSYEAWGDVDTSPAIGADGTIYVGSDKLYALNPDGSLKWSYYTTELHFSLFSPPAIGADGTIYVGSDDDNFYALNPDGNFKWSYTTGSYGISSPAIGTDGTIYFGSDDDKLYVLNPDGSLKWSYTTGGYISSSPAIGVDSTIYVGSYDDKLYALNPDGSLKWSYTTGGGISSSPAIGADGTIYVGSDDNKLYAFGFDTGSPDISISAASCNFGNVDVDNPKVQVLTVTNIGTLDLIIGEFSISGPYAAQFSLQNDNCSGKTIAPSQNSSVKIIFLPLSGGIKTATLNIPSNDLYPSVVEVPLTGVGMEAVPQQYTLIIHKEGAGSGKITSTPAGLDCGLDCMESYNQDTQIILTATSDSGSTFTGWINSECSGTNTCTITMDKDITVTAGFEKIPYTITATSGLHGQILPAGEITVAHGEDKTFSITPDQGYHVDEVKVDGQSAGVITIYSFSGVIANHTIEASFKPDTQPPEAKTGENQTIAEGSTVTLNASNSSDPGGFITSNKWTQVSGPSVTFSDANAAIATFVTPPVEANGVTLTFQLTVEDSASLQDSCQVSILINDNGITTFPNNSITMNSSTEQPLGLKVESGGNIVELEPVDPNTVANTKDKPENLIYGLIDMRIKVNTVGATATVVVYLPNPAPFGYKWYKYNLNKGWHDYSGHATFNNDRTQITLTLTDGDEGDDDGIANGMISDPSGLGTPPQNSSQNGDSGGGGCFITTIMQRLK